MIRSKLKKLISNYFLEKKRQQTTDTEFPSFLNEKGKLLDLTKDEINAVNSRRDILKTKASLEYWKLYKTYIGFNPDFIADDDFMPIIIRSLNPSHFYKAYQFKGTYPLLFADLKQPYTYLNCIGGGWYDNEMNVVERSIDTVSQLFKDSRNFIIKPTHGSCSGKGVQKIDITDINTLFEMLISFGDNFICQEIVKQSALTKQFSDNSLNTFRISTLNINGSCTVETIIFRHGRNGSICDNGLAGGIMVGVNYDGKFADFGWDKHFNTYSESETGVKYKDVIIPNFCELLKTIKKIHSKYLPTMGFAGWDFALNEDNELIFIEVNLGYPGIMFEQLAPMRPIFGNRTDEVYEYVKKSKSELNWRTDYIGSAL